MANAATSPPGSTAMAGRPIWGDDGVTLRPLTAADESFDRALFDEDRGAQFLPLGLGGAMLTMLLDQQYRAQQLGYRNEFPDADHVVIDLDGRPVGRLTTALRPHGDGLTLHVATIVLSTSARGRGIGTAVIRHLDDVALARGATRLTLSVLRGNDGAYRLYERLGFRLDTCNEATPHIAMVKPLDP